MAEVSIESLAHYLKINEHSPPVIIKKSSLGGRGLFATEFIKKGSVIFKNTAIVIGPRADCVKEKFCSNCYLKSDLCYPCEKCYAYICSEHCRNSPNHTHMCTFVHHNWKLKSNPTNPEEISKILNTVLIYLRFLLLTNKQKLLLSVFQNSNSKNIDELKSLLLKYTIPKNQIEYMEMVESAIKINSFRISYCPNENKINLRGLFPLSAFMNHSCVPNTRNVFQKDYTMIVYATRDIEQGEEISSCYTGLLWCTPARRCQLYKMKNFWCNCKRCSDSTEMGTNLSAINCLKNDCIGNLLPLHPLESDTIWTCNNCKSLIASEKINMIQGVLGSLVGALKLDNGFQFNNEILKRLAVFIPNSNHIFVDIKLRLAITIGFSEDVLDGTIEIMYTYGLTF